MNTNPIRHALAQEALLTLMRKGLRPHTPNPHQIKVGRFNYYWTTGTITIDSGPKVTLKGLYSFVELIERDQGQTASSAAAPSQENAISSLKNRPAREMHLRTEPDEAPF